jgi:hypothetical protein
MPYIRYITKNNGFEYASIADSKRDGDHVNQGYLGNLGRVVDKSLGIFKNRERGLFCYSIEDGYTDLPEDYTPSADFLEKERLILDFGDSFFLHEFIGKQTFNQAIGAVVNKNLDTLMSLLYYRILTDKKAYLYADTWYKGNYASVLFPKAHLRSQRLSEFLVQLGNEENQRRFFAKYFECLYGESLAKGIVIDSSGLPNASRMSITQISNHNGEINLEARLIYVLDRKNGMPIYFRYCPGNIVDVSTLCTTLAELKQYKIDVDYVIVDAGYFSELNVKDLYKNKVKFVTRLAPNRTIFKEAYNKVHKNLTSSKNALRYGNRLVYIVKEKVDIYGYTGFAYVGVDVDSRNQQTKRAAFEAFDDKLTNAEMDAKMAQLGLFVIISSESLPTSEILPLYYTRQQIEQVFDVSKNNADILPIRVQNEDTFRGHLMLAFLATVVIQKLQRDIITNRKKSDKICPEGAFMSLRNQKCKVFQKEIVPQETVRTNNELYKMFNIKCPTNISKCSKN